jgi:hypothetical protein
MADRLDHAGRVLGVNVLEGNRPMSGLWARVLALLACLSFAATLTAADRPLWRTLDDDQSESRRFRVDPSVLIRGPTSADSTFSVKLPDGIRTHGVVTQTRIEGPNRFVSTGRLGDDPAGEFLFIVDRDQVGGTFGLTAMDRYLLLPTDEPGVQRLLAQPGSTMNWGSGIRPTAARTPLPRKTIREPVPAATSPVIIDVLMLYTPRVLTLTGSVGAAEMAAGLAVQQANQAYADSGVTQRLRLVRVEQIAYTESGVLQTDLDRLTRPSDGFMDLVIPLRISYRADLVHLMLSQGDQTELGWLNNFSTFNQTWSFSVSALTALSVDAFTRAIGSNQGLDHDWVAMSLGAYPQYSFGYSFTGGSGQRWKTLMSNGTGTRLRRHSNPAVLFDGVPTGQPLTAAMPADAAQSLNNTNVTIASIMDGTIVPPPVINSPSTASAFVDQFFQYLITATNGPTSFGAAGLPSGLSIDTHTGLITGAVGQPGVYTIDLSATNEGGTGLKVLTLTVDAPGDCPVQRVARRLETWGLSPSRWLGQSEPRLLDICRRFRDDTLRRTPEGRELVELYYRHQPAVLVLWEQRPDLMRDTAECLAMIAPQLSRTTSGDRLSLAVAQRRQVDHLLARYALESPAEVSAAVAQIRQWLDSHTGLSVAE